MIATDLLDYAEQKKRRELDRAHSHAQLKAAAGGHGSVAAREELRRIQTERLRSELGQA